MLPGLSDVPHADVDRIWVTRDGRYLRLGEMTTDHLRNAVAMLQGDAEQPARIGANDGALRDPLEVVRREEMAAAMRRVIASRNERPSKADWPPRLSVPQSR